MEKKTNGVMETRGLIDVLMMSLIITLLPYILRFIPLISILLLCAVPLVYIKVIRKQEISKVNIIFLIAIAIINILLHYLFQLVYLLTGGNLFTSIILSFAINTVSIYVYFLVCNRITEKNKIRQEQISKLDNIEEIENTKEQLMPMIEPIIKPLLKSPISAVFCEPKELLIVYDIDNIYNIHGYVNSQNGYGAMIKTGFKVRAKYINNKWEIISSGMENQFAKALASNYIIAIVITILLFAISSLIVNMML